MIFKADELFEKIELTEKLDLHQFADIAYNRGKIAEDMVRWNDAAEHYARAAKLHTNFKYLTKAQTLAYSTGNYSSALSFGNDAIRMAKEEHGEESEAYATSLHNLAAIYHAQRLDEKAEPLYEQAIHIYKNLFGENDVVTATSLNNLASVYKGQENYDKAEPLYQKSLKILRNILGDYEPQVASTLNNLAGLYQKQGRYEEAERSCEESLKIRKRSSGKSPRYRR